MSQAFAHTPALCPVAQHTRPHSRPPFTADNSARPAFHVPLIHLPDHRLSLVSYDIGIISSALLQLRDDFALSGVQQELVVSLMLLGALVASLVGGLLVDRFGRRDTIIANAVRSHSPSQPHSSLRPIPMTVTLRSLRLRHRGSLLVYIQPRGHGSI